MQRNITVNLGNLVLSLSDAMDLASPYIDTASTKDSLCCMGNGESRKTFK